MLRRLCVLAFGIILSLNTIAQVKIEAEDARRHVGEVVTVCARVHSARYLQKSTNKPTLLNLGAAYPNQLLTVAIFEIDRKNFPFKPEEYYANTEVCVTGKLVEYKGSPEIVVQSPDQITLQLNTASNSTISTPKPEATPEPPTPKPAKTKPVPPTPQPPSVDVDGFEVALTNDVNLRAGPGTGFAPITVLQPGSVVVVLKSNNGWSYVKVKKAVGSAGNPADGYIKNSVLK